MKNKIISVLLICNILSAKELGMDVCISLLSGGIYNSVLEDTCGFKGGLSNEMKTLYTQGKCRYTVPQTKVNHMVKDVTEDTWRIRDKVGEKKFCKENKKQYYILLGSF